MNNILKSTKEKFEKRWEKIKNEDKREKSFRIAKSIVWVFSLVCLILPIIPSVKKNVDDKKISLATSISSLACFVISGFIDLAYAWFFKLNKEKLAKSFIDLQETETKKE